MNHLTRISVCLIMSSTLLTAQPPEAFQYQAVARDASGGILTGTELTLKTAIRQGKIDGPVVYSETFTVSTGSAGLINVQIGTGNLVEGSFENISWGAGPHFLETWVNETSMGAYRLLSVPYALYAEQSASAESVPFSALENLPEGLADGDDDTQLTEQQVDAYADNNGYLTQETNTIPVQSWEEILQTDPDAGDRVYNTTDKRYMVYDGTYWNAMATECYPKPTPSDAGADQFVYDGSTTTQLTGNTPEPGKGTGEWYVYSGEGGSFADKNDPATQFTGQANEKYELIWRIMTECEGINDYITIIFAANEPGGGVTDIDGNTYQTVMIGEKEWMAENLETTRLNDGTSLTNALDVAQPAYAWFQNDQATYREDYGALYNGHAVNSGNLCPSGWHVATQAEWDTLAELAGGYATGGGTLKDTTFTHWKSPNDGATNALGFTALPGSYASAGSFVQSIGDYGFWWSATGSTEELTYYQLFRTTPILSSSTYNVRHSLSVRCVKDD